jgi:hypothetical protein
MASSYRLMMLGVIAFMAFGAGMAFYGYQASVYPIDSALGYLSRAETAQTPEEMADYVLSAKRVLPRMGNPVWSFPTARTDFSLIHGDLDNILSRANSISSVEPHSSAYSTGLNDIRVSLQRMQVQLTEALPYVYVSSTNIVLGSVWIAVILGFFAILRKGRAKYREEYENQ